MPAQHLIDAAHAHVMAEGASDFDATLATLEGEPVYELLPVGLRMRGMDAARRYYRHFFDNVQPRMIAGMAVVHGNWLGETGLAIEYTIGYRGDDGVERSWRILGILTFGEKALTGERVYADEELLRIMFAPLWDEMEVMTQ
ncbi:hypothetical protein J3E64_002108 [Sphingobium sp. OAS761]|uniref:hypothetical protein n=1 Tax=Sphingobium sp. OAS761 TaxID=2817901 RepID=UPI0020A215C0|nr:hypothetical protein [Sphingobium sp. OAS761]MCP1470420.1 hypothetical protein [Sphingobium sp. OAS761]